MTEEEKYEEKLKGLNKDAFKVPDGYFEKLSGMISSRIDLFEGNKTASVSPFETPEDYFEKLPSLVAERLSSKRVARPFFKRAIVLIPITCIILVFGYIFLNRNTQIEKIEYTTDGLENSEFLQTIDETILADELLSGQSTFEEDTLTEYLLKHNIDLSDLESAL
jgi:hypothetical protein